MKINGIPDDEYLKPHEIASMLGALGPQYQSGYGEMSAGHKCGHVFRGDGQFFIQPNNRVLHLPSVPSPALCGRAGAAGSRSCGRAARKALIKLHPKPSRCGHGPPVGLLKRTRRGIT